MKEVRDRVAVVTGSAGGIGRAVAELLSAKGAHLALVDVDVDGLGEVAQGIRDRGGRAATFVVDVSDRDRMGKLPDEVVAEFGAVHILVNNAGVSVGATFAEQSMDDIDWILGINLGGVLYGCKFFLPYLEREPEAHIVNVSSMFGFLGLAGQSTYCVTKAGVRALSEALWTELADTSVRVTSVHPGAIRTNIIRDARIADEDGRREGIELIERWGHSPESCAKKIVRAIERDRRRVRFGPEAVVLDFVKRLFPVGIHRLLTAVHLRSASTERARTWLDM